MMFHLAFELPIKEPAVLDHQSKDLTREEIRILSTQIRRNSVFMDQYIRRLDLIVNKEKHSRKAVFVQKIRRQLELLMEENDTFREVLWKHYRKEDLMESLKS